VTEFDPEVLRRAQAGDRQAHAALYRAFAPMVFTLARRMLGSRSLAEDVLQDCFVEVIRKADQFRGDSAIGGWIRQIAVNKVLSQLRSPWWQRRVGMAGDDDAFGGEHGVATGAESHDAELERALDGLSATARAVLWLHAVEGYTHDEIGKMMGKSTSFSKSQHSRACAELRRILDPDDNERETTTCLGELKTI